MACRVVLGLLCTALPALSFNLEPRTGHIYPSPQASKGRESYFGFSVALQHIEEDNSNWVIVGAPRANVTYQDRYGITEPGAVFRCSLKASTCQDLRVDTKDNEDLAAGQYSFTGMKSYRWLGESLDSQPSYQNDRQATAVCAPNWIALRDDEELMNGVCYLALEPISNNSTFRGESTLMFKDHKYGQMGFSVHFPDDSTRLIVGAPGLYNWTGSVMLFKDKTSSGPSERKKREAVQRSKMLHASDPLTSDSVEEGDLLGYSVTSGTFLKSDVIHYAAGAPHGASSFGKVIVFEFPPEYGQHVVTKREFEGRQIGENFGAALTAADVNGDGLDDLLVAAPMHSLSGAPDVGRVYAFTSREGSVSDDAPTVLDGNRVLPGRFGASLAAPGDLNGDTYEDLVVGAPWEGPGALYIFLGSPTGLKDRHSQRLSPEQFPAPLRGFGVSISRGTDIDDNGYPDLAVGSFLSGHVVVIPSRPVATVSASVASSPAIVPWEEEISLNLTTCIAFQGRRVPRSLSVNAKLILDHNSSPIRASFPDKNNTHSFVEDLVAGESTCRLHQVLVQKDKINPDEPIDIKLEYTIRNNSNLELIKVPLTDPAADSFTLGSVAIAKDCNNTQCQVDMRTLAGFVDGDKDTVVIGKRNKLRVEVSNSGEPAYLPNLTVAADPGLALTLPLVYDCMFLADDRSSLTCNLSNPIRKSSEPEVLEVGVEVNGSRLMEHTSHLRLEVNVSGEGLEQRPADNTVNMNVALATQANLELLMFSDEQQVHYELTEDKTSILTKKVKFYHTYNVIRKGPSPLQLLELVLDIPVHLRDGTQLLKVNNWTQKFSHEFECTLHGTQLANESSKSVPVSSQDKGTPLPSEDQFESGVKAAEVDGPQHFNCSSGRVRCAQLSCSIHNWTGMVDTQSAEVSVELEVNLTTLAKYISAKEGAVFGSMATATIQSLNPQRIFIGNNLTRGEVVTHVKPAIVGGGSVPWWVIVLAVLGSLLVLGLVTYGLYKKGFFKRQEMDEMKAHRANLLRSPAGTANTAVTSD